MQLQRRLVQTVPLLAVALLLSGFAASAAEDAASAAEGLPVLSFNLRYDNPGDGPNAWPARKEIVASTILFHEAAVVGAQEVLRGQIADLEALLPGYAWFGLGRDDGKDGGEFNPVFYDKSRLKLLEQATFWLSETPDVPGSRGWDGACNRIVTWGRFEEIASGRTLHVFNTHLDHVGPVARREGARLLARKVAEIAGPGPAVVTGDFNCTSEEEPYRILTAGDKAAPPLRDARAASLLPPYGGSRSFNGFRLGDGTGSIIDHIFIRGPVVVARTGVIADVWDGRFVSDHFPVLAEIVLDTFAAPEPRFLNRGIKRRSVLTLLIPRALPSSFAKRVRAGFSPGYRAG
jgi:endonuclease/exonuclease/phosphatase family metal-dependent hydrolase